MTTHKTTHKTTQKTTDQVTDQVARLLVALGDRVMGSNELMVDVKLSHKPTFRDNYLNPALSDGWIERTDPNSPRSPKQKYFLSDKGKELLARLQSSAE